MKRKRWLAMALVFCLLGTTVPLTALAAGEDGEVQYIVSNDGTTLTIQGDGEITSQALDANVTAERHSLLWRLAPALQGLQMVTARYFPRV